MYAFIRNKINGWFPLIAIIAPDCVCLYAQLREEKNTSRRRIYYLYKYNSIYYSHKYNLYSSIFEVLILIRSWSLILTCWSVISKNIMKDALSWCVSKLFWIYVYSYISTNKYKSIQKYISFLVDDDDFHLPRTNFLEAAILMYNFHQE